MYFLISTNRLHLSLTFAELHTLNLVPSIERHPKVTGTAAERTKIKFLEWPPREGSESKNSQVGDWKGYGPD